MNVYRILKEPYWDEPLSVIGAEITGGRWNPPGQGILYTATSPELALLEMLVHFPKVVYEQLPEEWAEPTALPLTQTIFMDWLQQPADLGLGVPSAVMDISYNVILHPQHSLYGVIKVLHQQDLTIDRRLWNIPNP